MVLSKKNINFIGLVLVCILFFKPLAINSLSQYNTLNNLWDYARILLFLVLMFKLFSKHKFSRSLIKVISCNLIFLISTLLGGGNMRGMIVQIASILGFCFLIELEGRKDVRRFCLALFYGVSILIVLHTILMLIYPDGLGYDTTYWNKIYFLASKNGLVKFFFPAIVSGLTYAELNKKKMPKTVIFMITLCFTLSIVIQSTTSAIGIAICVLIYLINKFPNAKKIINIRRLSYFLIVFVFFMCILAFNGWLNTIIGLFVDIDKAKNYYDRIYIWQSSIQMIKNKFILGYGMPFNGGHINVNGKYMYSHNGFLEFFLYGGLVGFILSISMYFDVLKSRNLFKQYSNCVPVLCGIIGFIFMMITESHISTISYWGFFVLFDALKRFNIIDGHGIHNICNK